MYTGVHFNYESASSEERENQCTSLKLSSGNVFVAHRKQRETKSRNSFFFFCTSRLLNPYIL